MANKNKMAPPTALPDCSETADYVSLTDLARIFLKHALKISIFVLLVTITVALVVLLQPRSYKAECLLQVVMPIAKGGKYDQNAYEMKINSRLQELRSGFIAGAVAAEVCTGSCRFAASELERRVSVIRPPKSNLFVLTAEFHSPDLALAVLKSWVRNYMNLMYKNNINEELLNSRLKLKKIQGEIAEIHARSEQLTEHAKHSAPVLNIARGLDETQLWRELADKSPPDKLKDLSGIQVKGQEQNKEYRDLKAMVYGASQNYVSADAFRVFYMDVIRCLEYKLQEMDGKATNPPPGVSANAVQYAATIASDIDVVEFGWPALKGSRRGLLRKTAAAFFVSLVAAACCAWIFEQLKRVSI